MRMYENKSCRSTNHNARFCAQWNGDTLSYLVGAYQEQGDRVIGDVLKRMPGIEVSNDGGIKYNGKAIRKFYVEEMDLLQAVPHLLR